MGLFSNWSCRDHGKVDSIMNFAKDKNIFHQNLVSLELAKEPNP